MADIDEITFSGLQVKDNTVLVDELKRDFKDLYSINGEEINFESNTPDGQLIEILAFMGTTIREMITEVYNSCDPDKCVGAIQDNRYQINYLTRKSGSYTRQNIAITANKTVTLQGLDGSYDEPNASAYTISDNAGNIWYLIDTTTIYSGTSYLPFRAKEMGQVIPSIGTITNQVTIIDGVTNVINNVAPIDIGKDEESDSDFRIRRAQSVSKQGKSNTDTMYTELLELDGVLSANIHENRGSITDDTGTLPHYIWVVVDYDGSEEEKIAEIIYANSSGAGLRGNQSTTINSECLQPITINWDNATQVNFYIKFDIKPIGESTEINTSDIKQYITENLSYVIGEDVETSKITQICADAMLSDGGNGYALDVQVSTGGSATASISGSGITSASVNVIDFQYMVQDTAGSYEFTYSAGEWTLNSDIVDLTQYGITYVGTPENGDEITVVYTASVWSDYLTTSTIADKFTTDENKIYITIL